jgi:adenylate cyclase
VLQAAAVLGLSFDEALLQAVAGDVRVALQRLVEADLVRPAGDGPDGQHYRFSHALLHDVVYDNQLMARRSELHERAACALEQAVGPSPARISDLEALGHHWSFTSDKARGARYLTAAGDRARAVYANDDAIRLYERALATLANCLACEDQVRLVRERLADLLALTGRRADALAHHEAVRAELAAAADSTGAARLHRKIGLLHWEAGDREGARGCFDAWLASLGTNGDAVELAQLYQ